MPVKIFIALFTFTILAECSNVVSRSDLYPLSIIHVNDFHARFEETNQGASPCNPGEKCIGGYARLVFMVRQLLELRSQANPIYLNAGDNFQGTLWYNIGRWNVTSYFLNLLKADAITLGNHEFDHGVEGVVPFLEHIKSPMVVANIDDTDEPTMQGKYTKSVVLDRGGRKIGVIGVILQTTDQIANTGKLKFTNESEAVASEAERLHNNGVDIIIVLSHCGLDVDRVIAAKAGPYIDVIVGGHSHTFLYTGPNPPGIDKPQDKYPVEIIQENGHKVLIVQASAYLKYLGDITVYFDENGEIANYEGAPIYLDSDVEEDQEIVEKLKPWKEIMDKEGTKKVGTSRVKLSISRCRLDECNIGNFVTDAMLDECAKDFTEDESWTAAAIAMVNVGGIRTALNKGELTYAHIVAVSPFENSIDSFNLQGKHLLEALEYSVASSWSDDLSLANMLQVSGLKVTYNVSKPVGERVVDVKVRCQKCDVPKYLPLKENEVYRIITPSFLAGGGDGFFMIRDNKLDHKIGRIDIDVLVDYVKKQSPIMAGGDERITVFQ